MSGRIAGNSVTPFALKTKSNDPFHTPERKQQTKPTLQSQVADPFSGKGPKPALQSQPSIKPTGGSQTLPGVQSPSVGGNGVSIGGVDTFGKLSEQKHTQQSAPHEVGTPKHGSLDKVQFQTAHAGVTHTQGNGPQGVHHQQLNGEAGLLHAKHDKLTQLGPVQVHSQGEAALLAGQFEAGYHLNLDKKNPQAIAHIQGQAMSGAQGSVTGSAGNHNVKVQGKVEGFAGAKVNASGDAVFDPKHGNVYVQGGVEAFAGASAQASGKTQFGPVILSGHAGAEAGVKWGVGGGAGMHNGVIGANIDLGGAMGGGFSGGAGIGLDTNWFKPSQPAGPQLTRMGNITPAGAQHADQAVQNNPEPGPRLQRQDNLGRRQNVDLAA